MSIGQRIDGRYGELSPQEQRVADFILDHLNDLTVYNGSELARLSGVSKATVSRLFRRLGFADSAAMRDHARALRSHGAPIGGPGASAGTPSRLAAHLAAEQDNVRRLLVTVEDGRLDAAARLLATAGTVLVIGQRSSYPLALHLRQQLVQACAQVRLAPVPGQSLGEDLAGLGPGDAVVLLGFRRRAAGFGQLVGAIHGRGIPLVLIADASARRHAAHATHWLECPIDSVSAFDSYAAAMSLINLIATGAMGAHVRQTRTRIAAITSVYEDLDELEAPW